jgi:hypothetical protein
MAKEKAREEIPGPFFCSIVLRDALRSNVSRIDGRTQICDSAVQGGLRYAHHH